MQRIRDRATSWGKVGLRACLASMAILFPITVLASGWPGSGSELLGRLATTGFVGLVVLGCYAVFFTAVGQRLILLASVVYVVAGLLNRGLGVNGWVAFGAGVAITFILWRACRESFLVRKLTCAAVVACLLYPITVTLLPQMLLSVRLTLALVLASAIGAWVGWRVWPAIERWDGRYVGWWDRKLAARESQMLWQRLSAEAKGQVSAADFLKSPPKSKD